MEGNHHPKGTHIMQNYSMSRRRFLTVAGSTVILAGLGGLVGCSSNSNSGSGDNAAATTETKALARSEERR